MNTYFTKFKSVKKIKIYLDSKDESILECIIIHENKRERKMKQKYQNSRYNAYVRNDLEW